MKILLLNQELPFPANSGHRMRTRNFIRALRPEHELSILCFDKNADPGALNESKKYFKDILLVKRPAAAAASKAKRLMRLLGGIPWEISETYSQELESKLLKLLDRQEFDVIIARYIFLGQYLIKHRKLIRAKVIIDLDDIDFIKSSRQLSVARPGGRYDAFRRSLNDLQMRRYYARLRLADKVTVCSRNDSDVLKGIGLANAGIVPNTIEVARCGEAGEYSREAFDNKLFLFCGNLSYEPNIDGLRWFIESVFPGIKLKEPRARLQIVGSFPSREIEQYRSDDISIYANVPDVVPYYRSASAVIVPLRVAGGTRIKILEAFACRRPVVTTTTGAEGLELRGNVDCLIRDDEEGFAGACLTLLKDYNAALGLTGEGFRLVQEQFDVKASDTIIKDLLRHV